MEQTKKYPQRKITLPSLAEDNHVYQCTGAKLYKNMIKLQCKIKGNQVVTISTYRELGLENYRVLKQQLKREDAVFIKLRDLSVHANIECLVYFWTSGFSLTE